MKEIENVTQEIEDRAYKNVEGFDHTEFCYKTIFELMNDNGVFVKLFSELTSLEVKTKSQIKLETFKYSFIEEKDKNIYPVVDLIIFLKDLHSDFGSYFCLTLTPFNASMNNITKDAGVYGGRDRELTKIWRIIMKGFFGDKWIDAFKTYCAEVKNLKESEIATKAEVEYLKNEKTYEEEIGSIL